LLTDKQTNNDENISSLAEVTAAVPRHTQGLLRVLLGHSLQCGMRGTNDGRELNCYAMRLDKLQREQTLAQASLTTALRCPQASRIPHFRPSVRPVLWKSSVAVPRMLLITWLSVRRLLRRLIRSTTER